ncbi:MAG: GNAT family N-acetyltransferase [Methylovulum sp.]|uniref:GNAT family N-acetyltransferase n=1 Tax=Methylovulum sp. TaxID=1916980 RepID=UPI00263568B2|nr:GNAT family N-acetyltransferase [Methylovulum sp.]MDD2725531.1 GNAT family N-acetyltransferase [Methylovulum sp.]MDD5126139.1 GNAT family N-acetyltransferase [Methylovulum sp.]
MTNFFIKTMACTQLKQVLDWAGQEGWRPGLADAECFHQADPNGFFIGLLDGEPIGSISAVKYGDDYGFIGLYIVKPEWRNQGFGMQLWQTAMRYLQGRNIGLDGVIAQQANYQKSGFRIAYRHIRYQGNTGSFVPILATNIIAAAELPFAELLAYDRTVFPASRAVFLQKWLSQEHGTALVILRQNQLAGFGVIRACLNSFKIGPLFADDLDAAEYLLNDLLAGIPAGSDFFIDVPEVNLQAMALVKNRNLQPVFETARMYTLAMPDMELGKVFGVTTLELG